MLNWHTHSGTYAHKDRQTQPPTPLPESTHVFLKRKIAAINQRDGPLTVVASLIRCDALCCLKSRLWHLLRLQFVLNVALLDISRKQVQCHRCFLFAGVSPKWGYEARRRIEKKPDAPPPPPPVVFGPNDEGTHYRKLTESKGEEVAAQAKLVPGGIFLNLHLEEHSHWLCPSFFSSIREVLQNKFRYDFRKGPRPISAGAVFKAIMQIKSVNTVPAEIWQGHSKKWRLCFQSQETFKEEQSFPWEACSSAGRAIGKRESWAKSEREGRDNVASVVGVTAALPWPVTRTRAGIWKSIYFLCLVTRKKPPWQFAFESKFICKLSAVRSVAKKPKLSLKQFYFILNYSFLPLPLPKTINTAIEGRFHLNVDSP